MSSTITVGELLNKSNYVFAENWYKFKTRIAWFDKRSKNWITYVIDAEGHQVGEADYYANRRTFTDDIVLSLIAEEE